MSADETFAVVSQSADGIGKLKGFAGGQAEIEFFDSPSGPRLIYRHVPSDRVERVELSPQTRVFALDSATGKWKAGRVGGLISAEALRRTEDHYLVHFPNGIDQHIPISDLFVRWGHAIEDPTEYLAAKITGTPFFFEGRSRIVRHLATQRAAFGGMTGLASSAIELLEHQVSIVRKVLGDPIQRYLLADEVGLGKTVEAGVLIRQHLLDAPQNSRVVVVVPDHLVTQWRRELSAKFYISTLDARVSVIGVTLWLSTGSGGPATLLVLDEAHLLAAMAFSRTASERRAFEKVQKFAAESPRLLLLSGTPVLHQEERFLAMLHLLDSSAYPLADLEAFRVRVAERQTVAEAAVDLADMASGTFVEDAISRIRPLFPNDARLEELSNRVLRVLWVDENTEERKTAIRALRIHIRETYKLHRRLLRTRRTDSRISEQLQPRRGAETIETEDPARVESAAFLDDWRESLDGTIGLSDPNQQLFSLFVSAAFEHPRVLTRRIEQRIALLRDEWPPNEPTVEHEALGQPILFANEIEFLTERKEVIESVSQEEQRTSALASWISKHLEIRRAIIFVSDTEIADLVMVGLRHLLRDVSVWRFAGRTGDVTDFQTCLGRSVLVCDRKAEEGLNLQRSGATLIHFDLPLNPMRIEQRIGRVDRIQSMGRLRNVVFSGNLPYEQEWLNCLLDGIGVFSRSVSPLQYLLALSTTRLEQELIVEGRQAFQLELDRLLDPVDGINAETRRIAAQEVIDSVEVDSETEHSFFQRLVEVDAGIEEEGLTSLNTWIVRKLQFDYQSLGPDVGRFVHNTDRTLVPLFEAYRIFQDCVDYDSQLPRRRHELPFIPTTISREVAEERRVSLLRVGSPMLDAIEGFVRQDDRGAVFAYWRYLPSFQGDREIFLRFDFFVEAAFAADVTSDESFDSVHDSTAFQRRADEIFPVQYISIWLTSDLDLVYDPVHRAYLRLRYSRDARSDGSFDRNLNQSRWVLATQRLDVSDWQGLCERARESAERHLRDSKQFRETSLAARSRYEALLAERMEIVESRLSRLSGSLREAEVATFEREEAMDRAVLRAISEPRVRVDSVGCVILSSSMLESREVVEATHRHSSRSQSR
jgi:ATP-dependent helicase HepA